MLTIQGCFKGEANVFVDDSGSDNDESAHSVNDPTASVHHSDDRADNDQDDDNVQTAVVGGAVCAQERRRHGSTAHARFDFLKFLKGHSPINLFLFLVDVLIQNCMLIFLLNLKYFVKVVFSFILPQLLLYVH